MQRQASDSGNYNSTNSNSHPSSNTADATPNERSQLTREMTRQEAEQEKKDIELAQLLEMMVDWKPIIPDEVIDYYLQKSGFETDDLRVSVSHSSILPRPLPPSHHALSQLPSFSASKSDSDSSYSGKDYCHSPPNDSSPQSPPTLSSTPARGRQLLPESLPRGRRLLRGKAK